MELTNEMVDIFINGMNSYPKRIDFYSILWVEFFIQENPLSTQQELAPKEKKKENFYHCSHPSLLLAITTLTTLIDLK